MQRVATDHNLVNPLLGTAATAAKGNYVSTVVADSLFRVGHQEDVNAPNLADQIVDDRTAEQFLKA